MMKDKWVSAFMDTVYRFAQLSSARRLKVGSLIVKDNRIISIGYNGMPSGWDNDCEHWVDVNDPLSDADQELRTRPEVIHAEANAIIKLARDGESGKGASLFCTHAPCINCAKLIYGTGILEVYYREKYKDEDGLKFLEKSGIKIHKV